MTEQEKARTIHVQRLFYGLVFIAVVGGLIGIAVKWGVPEIVNTILEILFGLVVLLAVSYAVGMWIEGMVRDDAE